MEFSERYKQLYRTVIQEVVGRFDLDAYHVGEIAGPGIILQDIERGIIEAEIIIAEITPVNPNVFYELGFAHGLRKPTILLAERGTKLPFDVSGYRVLLYENTIGSREQLEKGLAEHLRAILSE